MHRSMLSLFLSVLTIFTIMHCKAFAFSNGDSMPAKDINIADSGQRTILSAIEPIAIIISPSSDIIIEEGETVWIDGYSVEGEPPFTYFWEFDGAAPDSEGQDPGYGYITFSLAGEYTITFTVIDAFYQVSSDSVIVTVVAEDACPHDPDKIEPGVCGCGVPDTDTDGDETADCIDECDDDPYKTAPGICGCGVPDTDTDNDGIADCNDDCPDDPDKIEPGVCGCGVPDTDNNHNGIADCNDATGESALYFPHVDTNDPWDTEICVINTSNNETLTGTLNAYDDAGSFVDSMAVSLDSHARSEIAVDDSFGSPGTIGYIVLNTDSTDVQGYTKFFQTGKYRVAVPAVKDINTGDIYVSHIDSSTDWWTGIALVNTTDASVTLAITFNVADGAEAIDPVERTLAANAHEAFTIRSLFDQAAQPDIRSAVITDAAGVVGLSLFGSSGSGNQLSGILLKGDTADTIFYPHVVSDATWWTGIVAYNPAAAATALTITPYQENGTALTPQTLSLDPGYKYVGTVAALEFPEGTAWLKIGADNPVTGFELFGTLDINQLAGYTGAGISTRAGVFPKIEKNGWTGIAFVNAEETAATVSLTAYDDSGTAIASDTMDLNGYEKVVGVVEDIFEDDISAATYIHYSCANEIVGFQLNGSADDMLLDGLPGLAAPAALP